MSKNIFGKKRPEQTRYERVKEGTQIFVNQSLCPYYKSLWSKSKKLRSLGKIPSFFISNNTIETKLQENSNPDSITHSSDFQKFFPDVDLVPSNL